MPAAISDPWQLYRMEARLIILERQLERLSKRLTDMTALAKRLDKASDSLDKVVQANQLPK